MSVQKTTNVDYSKNINGNDVKFIYQFGEAAPVNVSISTNLTFVATPGTNGFLNINVKAADRAEALAQLKSHIDAAFTELENVLINYQDPEQPA